jgi:hypothetical protein
LAKIEAHLRQGAVAIGNNRRVFESRFHQCPSSRKDIKSA